MPDTRLVARSRLYRTRPFGPVQQGDFVNAVAGLLTQLPPCSCSPHCAASRPRRAASAAERWGPRTLDLDLLVFGEQRIDEPQLAVPHPGIAERDFVLSPLADIAPTLLVPGVGRVEELLRRLPDDGIAGMAAA